MTYKWYEIFNHSKRQYVSFYDIKRLSPVIWYKYFSEMCAKNSWNFELDHMTEVMHARADDKSETMAIEEYNEPDVSGFIDDDCREEIDIDYKIRESWPREYEEI